MVARGARENLGENLDVCTSLGERFAKDGSSDCDGLDDRGTNVGFSERDGLGERDRLDDFRTRVGLLVAAFGP